MKKMIVFVLVLFVASLSGCGGDDDDKGGFSGAGRRWISGLTGGKDKEKNRQQAEEKTREAQEAIDGAIEGAKQKAKEEADKLDQTYGPAIRDFHGRNPNPTGTPLDDIFGRFAAGRPQGPVVGSRPGLNGLPGAPSAASPRQVQPAPPPAAGKQGQGQKSQPTAGQSSQGQKPATAAGQESGGLSWEWWLVIIVLIAGAGLIFFDQIRTWQEKKRRRLRSFDSDDDDLNSPLI